jgi:hypothetical protein
MGISLAAFFSSSISSSSRSGLMKLQHLPVVDEHHRRIGAGAQALAGLHRERCRRPWLP